MPQIMAFVCPELEATYEAVYGELAGYMEIDPEEAVRRFAPDDAVARVRFHRRQAVRRQAQTELAAALGIDPGAVFAACTEAGARLLLDALREKRTLTLTTHAAEAVASLGLPTRDAL